MASGTVIVNNNCAPIHGISEQKWKELIDYEEYYSLIYDIREEIISRAFEECTKRFFDKECVKFVVDCTYEAWKQIICLNFFTHDMRKQSVSTHWLPDDEPEPCVPDSWAKTVVLNENKIPQPFAQQTDEILSDYQLVKLNEYPDDIFSVPTIAKDEEKDQSPLIAVAKVGTEPEPSTLNVQFTSTTTSTSSKQDSGKIKDRTSLDDSNYSTPKRCVSENIFYKIMKMNMSSLPSVIGGLRVTQKKKLPGWYNIDEISEDPKKLFMSPLRLNVTTSLNVHSKMVVTRQSVSTKTVQFGDAIVENLETEKSRTANKRKDWIKANKNK